MKSYTENANRGMFVKGKDVWGHRVVEKHRETRVLQFPPQ